MYVFSTIEHHVFLEMALTKLEEKGIEKQKIIAVPLKMPTEERELFDSIHHADGISLIDTGAALATAAAVIGASLGYRATWGPIVWGILSAFIGFIVGFLIDLYFKGYRGRVNRKKRVNSEVIIIVCCEKDQIEMVENVLSEHLALGIGRLDQ